MKRLKKVLQVFEYGNLAIGDGAFTEVHFNSMVKMADKLDSPPYKIGHKKIKFQNFVGVLQVGDLTIEVLPKADKNTTSKKSTTEIKKWRDALFRMLIINRRFSAVSKSHSSINSKNGTLFDLYIAEFLFHCDLLKAQGLQRKYSKQVEILNYYKGRVLFGPQISKNLNIQAKCISEYDSYSLDHSFHRILRHALDLIPKITANGSLVSKSKVLKEQFPEVALPTLREVSEWQKCIDRNTVRYREAMQFAELIIKGISPIQQTGNFETIAFLFDMNKLFEGFIMRCLEVAKPHSHIEVHSQQKTKFWENKTIRPDILIKIKECNYILDTKWKVLTEAKPADDDLRQMYAYNNYFHSTKSFIIYPDVHNLPKTNGKFHKPIRLNNRDIDHSCSLFFINIFDQSDVLLPPTVIGESIYRALSDPAA